MRIMKRVVVVVLAAVAVLAVSAGAASAQIEVQEEADGAHCSSTNVCHIDMFGLLVLTAHTGGVETAVLTCNDEYEGAVSEAGEGAMTHIMLGGANCPPAMVCRNTSGQVPWPFHFLEEANTVYFVMEFCVPEPSGRFVFCDVEGVVTDGADHNYMLTVDDFTCPTGFEFDSSWVIGSGIEGIEMVH